MVYVVMVYCRVWFMLHIVRCFQYRWGVPMMTDGKTGGKSGVVVKRHQELDFGEKSL